MADTSEFEQWVRAIHDALSDETVEFGLFSLHADSMGALRRVVWMPTTFKCDNNRYATFGTTSNGTIGTDELFVEAHITGADFTDTCDLRARVMNATRQTLGTFSRPVDGRYFAEEDDNGMVTWGSNSRVVQRFAWNMNVAETEGYTVRVREIQMLDGAQINTVVDGVLTPSDQMDITEQD